MLNSTTWKKAVAFLLFCSILWAVLALKPLNLRSPPRPSDLGGINIHPQLSSPAPASPKQCFDAYREPGYLYIPQNDYRSTQWIPFDDSFHDLPDPEFAAYPDNSSMGVQFKSSGPGASFLGGSSMPKQWMQRLLAEHNRFTDVHSPSSDSTPSKSNADGAEEDISWIQGRRVLLIGDSVDRNMMKFFCEEFTSPSSPFNPIQHDEMKRTVATCYLPTLNLTLEHWHFPGTTNTRRPEWWWMKDMAVVPFEDRWNEIWHADNAPTPDLILWQTALWDQRAFWESGMAWDKKIHGGNAITQTVSKKEKSRRSDGPNSSLGTRSRQLTWQELRFFASRLPKFLALLQARFVADPQHPVPLMYRTTTLRSTTNGTDSMLFNIDRVSRSHAMRNGIEIFEWGRIISDLEWLYMDNSHPGKGAASWLWGNMLMEYLSRAVSGEWETCHNEFVAWGGR